MLTLYHAPRSRSTRVIALLLALGRLDQVDVRIVTIPRIDGSGGRDPANPHPEGKVPLLVHDGVEIWETPAILMYLCELFPEAGLDIASGDPERGRFLSWMVWYGSVLEPVTVHMFAGIEHPALQTTFRGMPEAAARIASALERGPWLMGDRYCLADLLVASPFQWFPAATPDVPAIRDWVGRCSARGFQSDLEAFEAAA